MSTSWTWHGKAEDIILDGWTYERVLRAKEQGWGLAGKTPSPRCRTFYLEKGSRSMGTVVRMTETEFNSMEMRR